ALAADFAGGQFVHVAPHPGLSRLDGTYQRMLGAVEMLGGMLVLGRVATADMTTLETQAKVNPGVACLNAVLADVRVGFGELYLIKMIASIGHDDTPIFLSGLVEFHLRGSFQRVAIPFGEACGGFVSALAEIEQGCGRLWAAAHIVVHKDVFV